MKKRIITAALTAMIFTALFALACHAQEETIGYSDGNVLLPEFAGLDSRLIAAQYADGRLTKLKVYDYDEDRTVEIDDDFNKGSVVKLFLWDALDTSEPECETGTDIIESKLAAGEKYAWIVGAEEQDGAYILTLYTQDNTVENLKVDTDIDLYLPNAAELVTVNAEQAKTAISSLFSDGFLKTDSGYEIRLVKYKSENGSLTKLCCAADVSSAAPDLPAVYVNTSDLCNIMSVAGLVNGYVVDHGILEFNVPYLPEDAGELRNYRVSTVDSKEYSVRENGSYRHYIVCEMDGNIATMVVHYTDAYDKIASMTDMPSHGDGPQAMIVDSIESKTDEDGYTSYNIKGYMGGSKRIVSTNLNTNLGQLTSALWMHNFWRNFDAPTVWDGSAGNISSPADYLEKGDILLYTLDGKLMAKFSSASGLFAHLTEGAAYSMPLGMRQSRYPARVGYFFGAVSEAHMLTNGMNIVISSGEETKDIVVPSNRKLSLVEIDEKGEVEYKGTIPVSQLAYFDDENIVGDYLYVSAANKGELNDMVVYRFTNDSAEPNTINPGSASPLGTLNENEDYGWIISADETANTVTMLFMDSGVRTLELSDTVEYWAPTATAPESVTDAAKKIKALIDNDGFLKTRELDIRLVKAAVNKDDKLEHIYCAVDSTIVDSSAAMRVSTENMRGRSLYMSTVGGYCINDGLGVFIVPNDKDEMNNAENYDTGHINSEEYAVKADGSAYEYILGDFVNGIDASVVVRYTAPNSRPAEFTEFDSAYHGPLSMLVTGVEEVTTDKGAAYKVNGVMNGEAVSITTNGATNLGILKENLWTTSNGGRNYDAESVWTAFGGGSGAYEGKTPSDILNEGDIILYNSDGRVIAKLFDAKQFAAHVKDGGRYTLPLGNLPNRSILRTDYYLNTVTYRDMRGMPWITVGDAGVTLGIDEERQMNCISVNADGSVEVLDDAVGIQDIEVYGSDEEKGDWVYINVDGYGDLKDAVVIRIK